jgi:hypothetical protein
MWRFPMVRCVEREWPLSLGADVLAGAWERQRLVERRREAHNRSYGLDFAFSTPVIMGWLDEIEPVVEHRCKHTHEPPVCIIASAELTP